MDGLARAINQLQARGLYAFEFDAFAERAIGLAKARVFDEDNDWDKGWTITGDGKVLEKLLVVMPHAETWQVCGVPTTPPGNSFQPQTFATFDEALEDAAAWLSAVE